MPLNHTARPITALALIGLMAHPAAAQDRAGWLDILSPERVILHLLQSGVMALRTQVDLKYSDMSVRPLLGQVQVSDLQVWPMPEWDHAGNCEIRVERLSVRSAALDETSRARGKVTARGVNFPMDCLPPDIRPLAGLTGQDTYTLPRVTLDIDYDIASAGALVHLFADGQGLGAIDLTADFSYAWFDGRSDLEDPDPVFYLSSAALTVENRGLWDVARNFVPPALTDADTAPDMVDGMLRQMLAQANTVTTTDGTTTAPLTESQEALITSAVTAWTGFLANPQRIVLETGMTPGDDVLLDFKRYEDDATAVFDDLKPAVVLAPAPARAMLPAALVQQALADASGLAPADRLRIGQALVTGNGAPRNIAAGITLLQNLAEGGDPQAALALSRALTHRDPEAAYRLALLAGTGRIHGAIVQIDLLEAGLPFARVLELQAQALQTQSVTPEDLADLSRIRTNAAERLSGDGLTRSYATAAMWASMGAAAGDAESADLLAQIDERVRLAGPQARAAWTPEEAQASRSATELWLTYDLPARLGGQ